MKLILVLAGLFVVSTSGSYLGSEKFFNMYLRYRFAYSCLGFQNMKKQTLMYVEAVKECLSNNTASLNLHHSNSIGAALNDKGASKPLFPEAAVRWVKNEAIERIQLYVCAARKVKMIDDNYNLLVKEIIRKIKMFKLEPKLERDILEGINYCEKSSKRNADSGLPSGLPRKIRRFMGFLVCNDKEVAISCLRDDLRKTKSEYELAGLDGIFSNLSDEDKIMEIVWANLQMNAMTRPEEIFF